MLREKGQHAECVESSTLPTATKAGQTVELDYDILAGKEKRRAGKIIFAPCRMGVQAQVRFATCMFPSVRLVVHL